MLISNVTCYDKKNNRWKISRIIKNNKAPEILEGMTVLDDKVSPEENIVFLVRQYNIFCEEEYKDRTEIPEKDFFKEFHIEQTIIWNKTLNDMLEERFEFKLFGGRIVAIIDKKRTPKIGKFFWQIHIPEKRLRAMESGTAETIEEAKQEVEMNLEQLIMSRF
jgi:hypothetical protein